MTERELRSALQARLAAHTYLAVIRRADALESEDDRRALLSRILERREESEGAA